MSSDTPDLPGDVAMRIMLAIAGEAVALVQEGVAGIAGVDAAIRLALGWDRGPFQMIDAWGAESVRAAAERLGFTEGPYVGLAAVLAAQIRDHIGFYDATMDPPAARPLPVVVVDDRHNHTAPATRSKGTIRPGGAA